MKSPFPGMDPYLEQPWRDVHHNLITFVQGSLNAQLPDGLIARVEERVFLESDAGLGRSRYPDVRVVEPLTEGYVEIIDVGSGNRVVTVVEVLSPSNKLPGEGQKLYLEKQQELLQTDVNLVEIDLLREGERVLVDPPHRLPASHRTPYQICVRQGDRPKIIEVYPVTLRQRLPRFRIPLRPADADITLDLQPVIDQCYSNGRYGLTINHKAEPEPHLGADDTKWVDEILRAAGKRL